MFIIIIIVILTIIVIIIIIIIIIILIIITIIFIINTFSQFHTMRGKNHVSINTIMKVYRTKIKSISHHVNKKPCIYKCINDEILN
jgi:hypothetical protein